MTKKTFLLFIALLPAALSGAYGATVSTSDGLSLGFNGSGRLESCSIDGLSVALSTPGGFYIADYGIDPSANSIPSNPGLESGTQDWNRRTYTTYQSVDSSVFHGGVASLKMEIPDTSADPSSFGRDDIAVTPGRRYRVGLWMRRHSCASSSVSVWQLDASSKTVGPRTVISAPKQDDTWTEISAIIYTSTSTARLYVSANIYVPGTVWLDDLYVRDDTKFLPVEGTVTGTASGIRVDATLAALQLVFTGTVENDGQKIAVTGQIQDQSGQNRAVGWAFRIPFDATGWTWHDDPGEKSAITAFSSCKNTYVTDAGEKECSIYPVSAITNAQAGLCFGVPLAQGPRVYTLKYDEQTYSASFLMGLSTDSTKWPSRGTASAVLFKCDPAWGFRSALERYYGFYPDSFRKRTTSEAFLNYANYEVYLPGTHQLQAGTVRADDASDFGESFRFLWHIHGCYSNFMLPGSDPNTFPSDASVVSFLDSPGGATYYCPATEARKKLVRDRAGNIMYIEGSTFVSGSGWDVNFRVNEDPEISDCLKQTTETKLAEYAASGSHRDYSACLTSDMIEGYDSSVRGLDFDPAHLAVCDVPLTFDALSLKPAVLNTIWDFLSTVWQPDSEAYKVAVYGNSNCYHQIFTLPFVDVPMIESDWDYNHPWRMERFVRSMSYHKTVRFWRITDPVTGEADDQTDPAAISYEFNRGLAYAVYPCAEHMFTLNPAWENYRSYYRRYVPAIEELSRAGWEPVPHAWTDNANVVVERYGSFAAGTLHFTLRNYASCSQTVRVRVDGTALGMSGADLSQLLLQDVLYGQDTAFDAAGGSFETTVAANGAAAFRAGTPAKLAQWSMGAAYEGLNRIERLFETELSADAQNTITGAKNYVSARQAAPSLADLAGAQGYLDSVEQKMTTTSPVDLKKVLYRIKAELSCGIRACAGLRTDIPRVACGSKGQYRTFTPVLSNTAGSPLEKVSVTAQSLSAETVQLSSAAANGTTIASGGSSQRTLRLWIPASPARPLLPALITVSGEKNGAPFRIDLPMDIETAGMIYGDADNDGAVEIDDARLVARYAAGLTAFGQELLPFLDVNGDGKVDAYDAALIARRAHGLLARFPVEP